MSPGLFEGTTAEDEHNLPLQLPKEVYEARMKMHRAEYITERDFTRIRSIGMNAVRIPVPYFIFGDRESFIGCIEELDKAFNWAEKYGLQILIDLHTAPGSQNGFDNGGESGVCIWSQDPDEVEFELSVLERLAQRYGTRKGLWGIEIINEPVLEDMWEEKPVHGRNGDRDSRLRAVRRDDKLFPDLRVLRHQGHRIWMRRSHHVRLPAGCNHLRRVV